jgi:DNA-binding SARP family transcriptional activator/tetratricopeptide (TPR) repeat protein
MSSATSTEPSEPGLELRVLGPIEIWGSGTRLAMPRSKKTRALLAYLAITGRAFRRERLCELLWDLTDDPRGALRWSLSRLRREIEWDRDRVVATREQVSLEMSGMGLDARELSGCIGQGLSEISTGELERVAKLPRGSFLEGLELADLMNFNAWCIAQRERYREEHCAVLRELVSRFERDPEAALPYARMRAEADALEVDAQQDLLKALVACGKSDEARGRYDSSRRLYRSLGVNGLQDLEACWRTLYAPNQRREIPQRSQVSEANRTPSTGPFVGRGSELARFEDELGQVVDGHSPRVLLISGEPGAGKSRLAERLSARAASRGFTVYTGRCYEAESKRAYGPWVDALEVDLGELLASEDGATAASRDALFSAVMNRLAGRSGDVGVLLVLDDLQWLDRDSVELVHFVARSYRRGPLLMLLLARGGELSDNDGAQQAIRSMRRERHLSAIELGALSGSEVRELVATHANAEIDSAAIVEACGGNPLYAIELARASHSTAEGTPSSLTALVRERIEELPDHAIEVLRWGAVLGHAISVDRIEALSSLGQEDLIDALEHLEHRALLRIDPTRSAQRYVFSHDVVRESVYADLSHPRRHLMHKKVVRLLESQASEIAVATEVAHHAGLAGEALPGVRACMIAGYQSLRVFGHGEAEALARRGLRLAEQLDGAERIESTIDLLHLQYSAKTPDRDAAAERIRDLAKRALDLGLTRAARLGFQMLSFLRWESSSMAAAHDNIMQAERVSRSAEPGERSVALSQAAKCLVLLERNLNQAEAFVMEASGLLSRGVSRSSAVSFATGMIAAHRGEFDDAIEALSEARELARQEGDRLAEFAAVEQWVMAEIDRGGLDRALELATPLVELGGRVRPGAEKPSGDGLEALVRLALGDADAKPSLSRAIEELRVVDAKYQLSYLLTRWSQFSLRSSRLREAHELASTALGVSEAIGRPSEKAFAHAILASTCLEAGDFTERMQHLQELENLRNGELSWAARRQAAAAMLPTDG